MALSLPPVSCGLLPSIDVASTGTLALARGSRIRRPAVHTQISTSQYSVGTIKCVAVAAAIAPVVGRRRRRLCLRKRGASLSACASATETSPSVAADAGLLLIEHINLNVLSTEDTLAFYEALGCKRDERRPMNKTLHSNCGPLTQFHTPSPANEVFIGDEGAQNWRGEVEMLYESMSSVEEAVDNVKRLKESGTVLDPRFLGVANYDPDAQRYVVISPYGDRYVLRVASAERRQALGSDTAATMKHRPGSETCFCIGMGGVTLQVPPGTAARGAMFFQKMFGFTVAETAAGKWAILGGPQNAQKMVLEEAQGATGKELGEHMAIYIGDYAGCFERLRERGCIFLNERFKHLDYSRTLEEAMDFNCFRFKDIIDLDSGEVLFELEHEVRSQWHRQCPLKIESETAVAA